MWWFRGLHRMLLDTIRAQNLPAIARVLDAGCGTGGLLAAARTEDGTSHHWLGLEIAPLACRLAAIKSNTPVAAGSVDRLPFAGASLDLIVSADVLCHAGVDEKTALEEFFRALKPGGRLLLNLPAYPWMISAHDRQVANARRYSKAGLERLLRESGFGAIRLQYWNSLLFPLMLAHRITSRRGPQKSDVVAFPKLLDLLFTSVLGAERYLAKAGIRLPFGGSIVAQAEKR